jgi:hypothetical protein
MRNILIPYILLFPIFLSCGDNQSTVLEKDLTGLLNYYNSHNWDGIAGMVYPEFFKAVNRNQFIQTLRVLDSLGVKRNFQFSSIEKISDILTDGNNQFCRVYYRAIITVTINKQLEPQAEHFKEEFEETYGKDNFSFDSTTLTFTINAEQSVIAVSNKDVGIWKYMELNNEHAIDIVAQVVPAGIMKTLTGSK